MNHEFKKSMTHKFLLITVIFLIHQIILLACSEDKALNNDDTTGLSGGYEQRYYEGMRYGLFVPPSYQPDKSYPLLVGLHGSTDTVSWDLSWYHDPVQANDPCFVLTPKSLV